MFGPGMPILFPMGLMALSILYVCERIAISKYYRMPSNFDDSMNHNCIRDILRAPFLYLGMGFWMFSNRQIFENIVLPIEFLKDVPRMNHTIIESVFFNLNPGSPFLILLIIQIIFEISMQMNIDSKFGSEKIKHFLERPPDNEPFFKTISESDKDWFFGEE